MNSSPIPAPVPAVARLHVAPPSWLDPDIAYVLTLNAAAKADEDSARPAVLQQLRHACAGARAALRADAGSTYCRN